jgi:hypothetical protein
MAGKPALSLRERETRLAEFVNEVEERLVAEFEVVGAFLAAKVLFVAVEFPAGDVLGEETGMAEFSEFGDDGFVGVAVVEHGVDEVAGLSGERSDFAGEAAAGRRDWWMSG